MDYLVLKSLPHSRSLCHSPAHFYDGTQELNDKVTLLRQEYERKAFEIHKNYEKQMKVGRSVGIKAFSSTEVPSLLALDDDSHDQWTLSENRM